VQRILHSPEGQGRAIAPPPTTRKIELKGCGDVWPFYAKRVGIMVCIIIKSLDMNFFVFNTFLTKNCSLFLEQGLSAIFQEFDLNKSTFKISLFVYILQKFGCFINLFILL